MTQQEILNALFSRADYTHIARDATVTVSLTTDEVVAIFGAYDRGLDSLDSGEREALDTLIAKLKEELHP